jgi:hypothetical protein
MTDTALVSLLKRIQRHHWLQRLAYRSWTAVVIATAMLIVLSALHTLLIPIPIFWWVTLALSPLAAAVLLGTFLDRPSLYMSATIADQWFQSKDLIASVWHLHSERTIDTPATRFVLSQFDRWLSEDRSKLPSLLPQNRQSSGAIALMLSASSCFLLSLGGATATLEIEHSQVGDVTTTEQKDTAQKTRDASLASEWRAILDQNLPEQHASRGDHNSNHSGARSDNKESMQPKDDNIDTAITESAVNAGSGAGVGDSAGDSPGDSPGFAQTPRKKTDSEAQIVNIRRTLSEQAVDQDRRRTVSVSTFDGEFINQETLKSAPAARVTRIPFSADLTPAYRHLQARYMKENSHRD